MTNNSNFESVGDILLRVVRLMEIQNRQHQEPDEDIAFLLNEIEQLEREKLKLRMHNAR